MIYAWHKALFWHAVNAHPVSGFFLSVAVYCKFAALQVCCLICLLCRAPQSAARWPARLLLLWPTTCSMAARHTRRSRLLNGWQSWTWPCFKLLCLSLAPPSRQVALVLQHHVISSDIFCFSMTLCSCDLDNLGAVGHSWMHLLACLACCHL